MVRGIEWKGEETTMVTAPVTCQKCSQNIPPEDVNVSEGVAFCRACSVLSRFGDMVDDGLPDIDLSQIPHGCELIDDGREIVVRASLRSLKSALTALPIALFWNGCLTVFVVQAIAVSYRHIYGQNASWLPAPNWPQFSNALPPV